MDPFGHATGNFEREVLAARMDGADCLQQMFQPHPFDDVQRTPPKFGNVSERILTSGLRTERWASCHVLSALHPQ